MTPVADKPLDHTVEPPAIPWAVLGWFGALIVLCYLPILMHLIRQWNSDDDMGHGFFVPVLAGYIAWQKRDEFMAEPARPNWLGLALVFYAALQLCIATLGAELFLARTALVFSIIGAVCFLGGAKRLRVMAFPLFLLFFMVPIPAIVYNQITFPLQLLASRSAEWALMLLGTPVLREGNILELAGEKLSVVDACSGIRSLLSLSFLSLVYGYFFEKKIWLRVVLFVATVPIAMLANAGRVTLTGLIADYRPEYAHGFMHSASGMVIFMVALAFLGLFHQMVNAGYNAIHGQR
jgi:exosortase